jgi:hypothetical protein
MSPGPWWHQLKWLATLACLAGLLALVFWANVEAREKRAEENRSDKVEQKRIKNDEPGEVTLTNQQANYPLEKARAVMDWTEPVTVYGRVVPNPRASYEVRSAYAGVLRRGAGDWPTRGQWVRAGKPLGRVEVRIDPQVRLGWQAKLAESEELQKGEGKVREILAERVKRFQRAPQGIQTREREEALIQLREAEAKEAVARSNAKFWETALAEASRSPRPGDSPWSSPLTVPADGEITEPLALPGTTVEAGAVVARLVNFRWLLVRLDFPQEVLPNRPPRIVDLRAGVIAPLALRGPTNRPLPGEPAPKVHATLVGPAPQVEPASPFASYFYEVDTQKLPQTQADWRPGRFVQADVRRLPGADARSRMAVAVPVGALLYHQGRAVIYVRLRRDEETTTYARREVQVFGYEGGRWILAAGSNLLPREMVVASGAQDLLSREFNAEQDD